MSRSRILVISTTTGYQLRAFAEAATCLGVDLVYASNRCHHLDDPWQDAAIPVRFEDLEGSVRAITSHSLAAGIEGVIAVGDQAAPLAAEVAVVLGLPWHEPRGARLCANKLLARGAWLAAGLPSPWFFALRPGDSFADVAPRLRLPCVVKPLSLSASRGVMKVGDPAAFEAAVQRVRRIVREAVSSSADATFHQEGSAPATLLVEGFLEGPEYALEGVMCEGMLRVLAIFEKPEPLNGPFFEEHIYVTPPRLDGALERRGAGMVAHAALATGLRHGPIHAEFRIVDDEVYLLEVAARPIGGLCARALRCRGPEGEACSLEQVLLAHAAGHDLEGYSRAPGASGVAMLPIGEGGRYRRVRGQDAARSIDGIDDIVVTAKVGQLLQPLPEGASYLGFAFASGAATADVVAALERAEALLDFEFDRPISVEQP